MDSCQEDVQKLADFLLHGEIVETLKYIRLCCWLLTCILASLLILKVWELCTKTNDKERTMQSLQSLQDRSSNNRQNLSATMHQPYSSQFDNLRPLHTNTQNKNDTFLTDAIKCTFHTDPKSNFLDDEIDPKFRTQKKSDNSNHLGLRNNNRFNFLPKRQLWTTYSPPDDSHEESRDQQQEQQEPPHTLLINEIPTCRTLENESHVDTNKETISSNTQSLEISAASAFSSIVINSNHQNPAKSTVVSSNTDKKTFIPKAKLSQSSGEMQNNMTLSTTGSASFKTENSSDLQIQSSKLEIPATVTNN